MQIELRYDREVEIDLTTKPGGTSAANLFVDDPNTVVYFGELHASVHMRDIKLRVIMDPDPGDWGNAQWARQQAVQQLCEALTGADLFKLFTIYIEAGQRDGALTAKRQLREALGIKERPR